jgi:putative membrane protein
MTKTRLCSAIALGALLALPSLARAADPSAGDVLPKLHQSNLKEIEMGKMAEKNGQSQEVKDFGRMLVRDHTGADKKVKALAKREKVDLPAQPESTEHTNMAAGPDFDKKFASDMLDDHKKDVTDASEARDKTSDPKLKKLLTDIVPTLEKHRDTAQKIVDEER